MEDINIPRAPHFPQPPNPLQEMMQLHRETTAALGDVIAQQTAMRGVLIALVNSHPNPKALVDSFLHHMDVMGDSISQAHSEKFRVAAQDWMAMLLAFANQQAAP